MLQLAALWTLSNKPVKSVVPTLIQEAGPEARSIESKLDELAALPAENLLSTDEVETIRNIGNNEGCMLLKGASQRHAGQEPRPDEWPMRDDLLALAARWGLGTSW